jgi:hypothetical protein
MRICIKNPSHRRLGAARCETPGCGGRVLDLDVTREPEPDPTKRVSRPVKTTETLAAAAVIGPQEAPRQPVAPGPERRVVIRHQSGSKANQTEQFPVAATGELTMGRDPTCNIVFDDHRDDVVSRRHAVIRISHGDRLGFVIADLGSSNGTLINGGRISSVTELMPGDTVQLGVSGPVFVFDVHPRPPHLMTRTRVIP